MTRIMLFFSLIVATLMALLPHIVWLVVWLGSKIFSYRVSYAPFGWVSLVLVTLSLVLLAYGFFVGRWHIQVVPMEYKHSKIPTSFDGFRIVHISDFHLSTFDDNPQQLQVFVDSIQAQNPDLVCFTGDLVTMGIEEAEPYTKILRSIHAPYGVLSVLGNHDFLIYNQKFRNNDAEREKAVENLARFEKEVLGWHLLRDTSFRIQQTDGSFIYIIGVDNKNCTKQGFKTINQGDLTKATCGTEGFRILLSHDPSHWEAEVLPKTDIQLTLSGHTHAAQIRLFGWTPARWLFRESDGLYEHNGQTLYVNIGLGCTAPFRLGAQPEITLITLQHKK